MIDRDPRPEEMPRVDAAALRADVERLAALGPRFCGTEGERRGRAFVAAALAEAGLTVTEEPFRYLAYEPEHAACELPDDGLALPCAGLQGTASTQAEGPAVHLGAGEEDDLADARARGVPLEGCVAVVRAGVPAPVAARLVRRGVAAIVNLGSTPDGHVGHFTATFYPPPMEPPWEGRVLAVPGVTVEARAGERLLRRLSSGPVRLRVRHAARYVERTTANVVAEIPGESVPGERVVIGAHYDTQRDSPGAADNGSGVAALLGLARAWRAVPARRTITFAAFAAEELACWGACHHVRARSGDGRTVAMVNLDALGPPLPATRTIVSAPELAPLAAQSARRVGWEPEVELDAREFPFADHAPFVDAGIPACWLWRYPPPHPYYHSAGDTPRWVDFGRLAEDAHAGAYVAFRLAHRPAGGLEPSGA